MNPIKLNKIPADQWYREAPNFLVDMPLAGMLTKDLFSSLDNFAVFQNNLLQTPAGYNLEIAVPGMSKKDLQLEVNNRVLTVQGQKKQHATAGWFHKTTEFRSTQMYKTFVLPADADADSIRAHCQDGLLKINIPRIKSERTTKAIPVKAAKPEMNWWQKLSQSVQALWNRMRRRTKQLAPGF